MAWHLLRRNQPFLGKEGLEGNTTHGAAQKPREKTVRSKAAQAVSQRATS